MDAARLAQRSRREMGRLAFITSPLLGKCSKGEAGDNAHHGTAQHAGHSEGGYVYQGDSRGQERRHAEELPCVVGDAA